CGRHALWSAERRQHEAGAKVVLTSDYLEEIEALAERVVVIDRGRVLVDDELPVVLAKVELRMVRLTTPEPDRVAALPGVADHRPEADGSTTFFAHDADAVVRDLVTAGFPFRGLPVRG